MTAEVFDNLINEITRSALNKPRDLQRTIGPSAVGTPCTRWLMHLIRGDEEPHRNVKWQAWVGTAMHSELEAIFYGSPTNQHNDDTRYLTEHRVLVGTIAGQEVWGNVDLFDKATGTVIDWKSAGKSSLVKYERSNRLHGTIGPKYETQAHLYGLGLLLAGHQVNTVCDVFLPRDGSLSDAFYWSAPFNPQIAMTALARCNQLADQIRLQGFDSALQHYPECGGKEFCPYCPYTQKPHPAIDPSDPFGLTDTPKKGTNK